MFTRYIKFITIVFLLYQTPTYSKSNSFSNFEAKNLSKYFSGIVAYDNNKNLDALNFFNSSRVLLDRHDTYLQRYTSSLVLEKKVLKAINLIKINSLKSNSNFFEAYVLLILDNLKKNNFILASENIDKAFEHSGQDRFKLAILRILKDFIFVFKEKKLPGNNTNLGDISLIAKTFQSCYLDLENTQTYFINLINKNNVDYTRYTYFFINFLVEKKQFTAAKEVVEEIDLINTTLLLSQGKNWIDNENYSRFENIFSCKNHNDVIAEFLFLISNLYSSQNNFERSNYYLNLSNFMNPKFVFNLSLLVENFYLIDDFKNVKKILKEFTKKDIFYYWYRIKKETQMISKESDNDTAINYIKKKYEEFDIINNKILYDLANFYKKTENYPEAINYYTKIINNIDEDSIIKPDILFRRGGSYERLGEYSKADNDFLYSLELNPGEAHVLNYLAYSWLERDYKIDKAIKMLEDAYESNNEDPYIIDSIGWAYFLTNDYEKAEKFLRRAVELMPDDPIVNDHYGDILWKLNLKIQARYFWKSVLSMEDAEKKMIDNINSKIIEGI